MSGFRIKIKSRNLQKKLLSGIKIKSRNLQTFFSISLYMFQIAPPSDDDDENDDTTQPSA